MTNKQLQAMIWPIPKQAVLTAGTLDLHKYRLEIKTDVHTVKSAASLITNRLLELGAAAGDTVITLQIGEAPAEVSFPEQAYRLEVTEKGVTVTGFGAHGLHYGAVTLVQLLQTAEVPCCTVLDWPDMGYRGHTMETRLGTDCMEKEDWFAVIDDLAMMKMNHLQLNVYGCWVVQYDGRVSEYLFLPLDGYPELKTPFKLKYYDPDRKEWVEKDKLPPLYEKGGYGEIIRYGYERGIMVHPGFNSYGHNTLIPATYPEVSAKDENGEPTLTGYCTANPKTYEMIYNMYDQIIDKYLKPYGVDCFDIVLDEVWPEIAQNKEDIYRRRSPFCKCPQCRDKTPGQLFIEHTVHQVRHLKEKGMKNVIICCDMLIDHGPNGIGDLCQPIVDALKEADLMDVVLVSWWTYADLPEKLMFHSTKPELGLRRVTTPWNGYYHWCAQFNSVRDIYMLAKMAKEEACEGMLSYSSWDKCQDRNNRLLAEYAWGYDNAGTIADVTDRYLRQNFPTKFEQARRAFQLFDYITEERIDQPEGNSSCLANYFMLRDRLSYYFYSYVEDDKPYPRIFPGEALQKVCARREDHVRAMLQVSGMAKEAMAIWEDIAKDPGCNQDQAWRYAYEANNYLVLVDDYLAMLRMMELGEEGDYTAIMALAESRKNARIALMARHQQTKDHYQQPWNLRNHSIFLQFFEDLRAYLEKTPVEEIKLDWFDMRYLASDRFFWLR